MTATATPPASSPQAEQFDQWMKNATALMEKHSTSLQELPEKIKKDLVAQVQQDIAKLSDKVDESQAAYRARFQAIADGHARSGGRYRGPFENVEQAKLFGNLVLATRAPQEVVRAAALKEIEKAAITPGQGTTGGYLVPDTILDGIIYNVEQYGVVERNAGVIDISSAGVAAKFSSGCTVYYPDEGAAPTEAAPKFASVKFSPTRYSAYCLLDNWMLQSNLVISLADFVATEMARALAQATDKNALIGDGTSTYARVVGLFKRAASTMLKVKPGNGIGFSTFSGLTKGPGSDGTPSATFLPQVLGALPEWADQGDDVKWYMHRTIFFNYLTAYDTTGRPLANFVVGADGKPVRVILGYPVEVSQAAPSLSQTAVGTTMTIAGALRKAMKIFRHKSGIVMRQSEHVKFLEGQTAVVLDVLQDIVELDDQAYCHLQTADS